MQKYIKFIGIGLVGLAFFAVILVGIFILNNKTVQLNDHEFEIAVARQVSRQNAGDGTAQNELVGFDKTTCEYLGKLAKEFDASSNFINCTSPEFIYFATPDTTTHKVVTLSDDKSTAKFTVDNEFKILVDYEFINSPSPGFNKFGSRK